MNSGDCTGWRSWIERSVQHEQKPFKNKRSFLGPSEADIVFIALAVVIRCARGAVLVFICVIAPDAERAAELVGQRRLADEAGVLEPGRSRRLGNPHSVRNAGVVT